MKSRLYTGELRHTRSRVTRHAFSYSLHLYALDLDEVDDLARQSWWFGHNRIRPIALHDRDYLHPGAAPLRDKVRRVLGENGVTAEPERIVLVTALRQFHYVFNPASFFFCLDAAGQVFTVLVQVNNTFGDTHLYLLPGIGDDPITDKVFHVSPFFPRTGVYRFHLTPPGGESLTLAITYSIDGEPALQASFTGRAEALTPSILARTALRHPLRAVLTFLSRLFLGIPPPAAGVAQMVSLDDSAGLMAIYSGGFVAVFSLFALLHWRAWSLRDSLGLDARQRYLTRMRLRAHLISVGVGAVSLVLAWVLPVRLVGLAGFLYGVLGPLHWWHGTRAHRHLDQMGTHE